LDKLLYVPLPTPDDRVSILKAISGKINLGPDVDLDKIGRSVRADGYSGADLAALLREAGLGVLKEDVDSMGDGSVKLCITQRHFHYAFNHVVPSVSSKDQARYNRMRDRMAHARSRGAVLSEDLPEEPADEHMEVTIDATTTTDAVAAVLGADSSQLLNVSEEGGGANDKNQIQTGPAGATNGHQ
jgi:hypothetical protein